MDLAPLFRPRSIAVVGASETGTSSVIFKTLDRLGFQGAVYGVNPRRDRVFGSPCYTDLGALPEPPDVVAMAVSGEPLLEALWAAPGAGAKSVVVYQGGFAEEGERGERLQKELAAHYRRAAVPLVGPNCLGVLSPAYRASSYLDELVSPLGLAGDVGFISHSGSVVISMLADIRRFGFSSLVSAGNEAVVTAAAYLEYFVGDPETRMVAAFLESVREPARFVAALDAAAAAGKPVVVLKVGRSARAQHSITTHTAGLAGDARVFSEVLRAHGAIEVRDQDEMTEVLATLQGRSRPTGRRTVVVTASGGQAELMLDLASDEAKLPPLKPATRAKIEGLIGRITGDGNPLDAWGPGNFGGRLPEILQTLDADDEIDNVVLCRDALDRQPMVLHDGSVETLLNAARRSRKPHFLLSLRAGLLGERAASLARAEGVVALTGARQGLLAIDRVATATRVAPLHTRDGAVVLSLPAAWARRTSIHEADAKALLAAAGLPTTREAIVQDLAAARAAAKAIGFPVALKAVSDDIPHKSDFGLVELDIPDEEGLAAAWAKLEAGAAAAAPDARLAGMLVQQMAPRGVEVFIGVTTDPAFGPVLAFGLGGVDIELHADVSLRLLPLRPGEAAAMIDETRAAKVLAGHRGRPPASRAALENCLERAATFAWNHRRLIREIDLNPVRVLPAEQGCLVVDALMFPHSSDPAPSGRSGGDAVMIPGE